LKTNLETAGRRFFNDQGCRKATGCLSFSTLHFLTSENRTVFAESRMYIFLPFLISMFNFSASSFYAPVRFLLALLLLAFRLPAAAHAPAWQSARAVAVATTAASGNYSTVTATAVDATGNVFLAGYFRNNMVLGGTTLNSRGSYDVFIAKFNPVSNQFVWVQQAGGTVDDRANALVVNGVSIYVAGSFSSSPVSFGAITLNNAGNSNAFVAKLTDAGSTGGFVWVQRAGGIGFDYATALAMSGSNLYVAGYFDSSLAGFGSTTLTNAGSLSTSDVFVAKITDAGSTGSFVWAQQAGGTRSDRANAVAVSGNNVYVTGIFTSPTVGLGATTLTNTDANAGTSDIFVAKLNDTGSSGSFVWTQQAGGIGNDVANTCAVSGTTVYVAGNFTSPTMGFGLLSLTNADRGDVFVAKLHDTGNTSGFVWAQRAGGVIGGSVINALAVNGTNVYVAGFFNGHTVTFGTTTLSFSAATDVFVAKLADAGSTGSFVWAQQAGGASFDGAEALAISGTSVYVAGYFTSPTASFGNIALSSPNPAYTSFLATLTDAAPTATVAGWGLPPAQLYPNPAHSTATLRLPAGAATAPLILTDALGRAVRHYPAPAGTEAALDLQSLPVGLYLLRGVGPAQRLVVE
jgi:hypothetical protein